MRLVAGAGRRPEMLYGRLFPTENELFQELFRSRRDLWRMPALTVATPGLRGEVSYTHGWLCVPLIVRGGIIGCVTWITGTDLYDDRDAQFASGVLQ